MSLPSQSEQKHQQINMLINVAPFSYFMRCAKAYSKKYPFFLVTQFLD